MSLNSTYNVDMKVFQIVGRTLQMVREKKIIIICMKNISTRIQHRYPFLCMLFRDEFTFHMSSQNSRHYFSRRTRTSFYRPSGF